MKKLHLSLFVEPAAITAAFKDPEDGVSSQ
jgi:hypothetical protein